MLIKFTDRALQTRGGQQYVLGEWVKPVDGQLAREEDGACGQGSLHLMKYMRPVYAPYPYLAHEAEGEGLIAEDEEKARFHQVRLIRTLTDAEIDQAMDDDWAERLGRSSLFLPISWARTATYLDRPVDKSILTPKLAAVAAMLSRPQSIRWVSMASVTPSLYLSLNRSLHDSLDLLLHGSLHGSLYLSLHDSLYLSLHGSLYLSLNRSLDGSLYGSLNPLLDGSLNLSLYLSLHGSLYRSLYRSLRYERGFVLAGSPRAELEGLLDVWQAGACPIGWSDNSFVVLA